jgi:uncharacterized protein YecA (UPF0149 family)
MSKPVEQILVERLEKIQVAYCGRKLESDRAWRRLGEVDAHIVVQRLHIEFQRTVRDSEELWDIIERVPSEQLDTILDCLTYLSAALRLYADLIARIVQRLKPRRRNRKGE